MLQQEEHAEVPSRDLKDIDGPWKGRSGLDLGISESVDKGHV